MTSKVADRLGFYLSRTKAPPQIFVTLSDTLPLLIATFEQVKEACEDGTLDLESQKRLKKAVEGCRRLVTQLEDCLAEVLPVEGESFSHKAKKTVKSIRSEKTIAEIQRNLETYKSTLTLYFSHLTATAAADEALQYIRKGGQHFVVPAMNVQYFVGREKILDKIDAYLQPENGLERRTRIVILQGMGGQGKTQLALEYCRKQRANHSVFWVDATSPGTAFRSFENLAAKIAPGASFPNPEAARTYVLKALETFDEPLLLVFDTFDQPSEFNNVKDFFPLGAKIVFTSRHSDSKRLGKPIEIGALSDDEGVDLLLQQAGLEKTTENSELAKAITHELAGLALAIDQAATYINARNVPLHSFPQVYKKRRAAILKHTPSQWEYRKSKGNEAERSVSVFTTWELSFEQFEAAGEGQESIIHLLTLAAFINTTNISEGLFILYSQQKTRPAWLDAFMDDGSWDSDKYQDSIVRLHSVSLVTTIDLMSDDARISFHPLVAEWLKLRIDQRARVQYTEEAIRIVRLFVDSGDKKEMPTQDKSEILAHIDKTIEHDQVFHADTRPISQALEEATISFGSFYRRLGRYRETIELVERAMSDQRVSPAVRNVLANMYCDQGQFAKAEELYNQILTSSGKSLPEVSGEELDVSTLGFIYWTQDDKLGPDGLTYDVDYYLSNLGQFEPWFASVLSTYNGLGVLNMKLGRLKTAESLLLQALDGRERAMGPEGFFTAEIMNHLGALHIRTGQYSKAEAYLRRALKGLNKAFGPNYMTTQLATHNLGILYMQQNHLDAANEIIQQTTEYLKSGFGPLHASTLTAFQNQAILYRKQGRFDEAMRICEKTIEGWKESNECDAKPEADCKYILAGLLDDSADRQSEAGSLYLEAAKLYSYALGEHHPQTKKAFDRAEAATNTADMGELSID